MMTPELVRWVADVLANDVNGVNALLSRVPRRDDDDAPPAVSILNGIDNAMCARGRFENEASTSEWVMAVRVGSDATLAGHPLRDGGDDTALVWLHIAGVTVESDNADALAHAMRLMRIARRVLLAAFHALDREPLVLDEQMITLPDQWTQSVQPSKDGAGTVDLLTAIPFTITDVWALGATE